MCSFCINVWKKLTPNLWMVVFFMSWKFLSHFTQIKTNYVFGSLIKSAVLYIFIYNENEISFACPRSWSLCSPDMRMETKRILSPLSINHPAGMSKLSHMCWIFMAELLRHLWKTFKLSIQIMVSYSFFSFFISVFVFVVAISYNIWKCYNS